MTTGQAPHPGLPGPQPAAHDNGSGGQPVMPMLSVPTTMPLDPRTLKSRIFSAERKRFRSEIVTFFGEQIEIRQPSLGRMLSSADDMGEDASQRGTFVLLNYAFMPGTEIPVFDASDSEQILSLPYGEDFSNLMAAFQRVTGISVDAAEKNSEASRSASK